MGSIYARDIQQREYLRVPYMSSRMVDGERVLVKQEPVAMTVPLDVDSLFYRERPAMTPSYLSQALLKAQRIKQDYEFKSYAMEADRETIRRHGIEMQKNSHFRSPV